MHAKNMSAATLTELVATKGGITENGITHGLNQGKSIGEVITDGKNLCEKKAKQLHETSQAPTLSSPVSRNSNSMFASLPQEVATLAEAQATYAALLAG